MEYNRNPRKKFDCLKRAKMLKKLVRQNAMKLPFKPQIEMSMRNESKGPFDSRKDCVFDGGRFLKMSDFFLRPIKTC